MKTDEFGQLLLSDTDAFDALYRKKLKNFSNTYLESQSSVQQINHYITHNGDQVAKLPVYQAICESITEFDQKNRINWFMPDQYKTLDIAQWLLDQCTSSEEIQRVNTELELYIQYDLIQLLQYLKYLVDTMREHRIVHGVGRGSSVASYCLYLMGVHRINSIKYQLPIEEFLKKGD